MLRLNIPWSQYRWPSYIPRTCEQTLSRNSWCSRRVHRGGRIGGRWATDHTGNRQSDSCASPDPSPSCTPRRISATAHKHTLTWHKVIIIITNPNTDLIFTSEQLPTSSMVTTACHRSYLKSTEYMKENFKYLSRIVFVFFSSNNPPSTEEQQFSI